MIKSIKMHASDRFPNYPKSSHITATNKIGTNELKLSKRSCFLIYTRIGSTGIRGPAITSQCLKATYKYTELASWAAPVSPSTP